MRENDLSNVRNGRWGYDRKALHAFARKHEYRLYPVETWGPYTYAVTSEIRLQADVQHINVYDLTGVDAAWFLENHYEELLDREEPYSDVATLLADQPTARRYALIYEGEGHPGVLLADGSDRWLRSAVLAISMQPADAAAQQRLEQQLMDELDASMDAGGSLLGPPV
jgi:hypothetical protein